MKQRPSLQRQADTLVENIIQSPALTTIADAMKFGTGMTHCDHADRMYQWLQITRVFYLSGQQLLSNVSLALNRAYIEKDVLAIQRLEKIRAKIDAVLADDGGHCRPLKGATRLKGYKTRHTQVHYQMFGKDIAHPLKETSGKTDITLRPATLDLMQAMEAGFGQSIEEGFSWILIVELIAEEIVKKMYKYLRKIKIEGHFFFSEEQLFYCTYHMLLEKLHAGDVKEGIRRVADNPERFRSLLKEVLSALKLWENFWLSQAKIGQ